MPDDNSAASSAGADEAAISSTAVDFGAFSDAADSEFTIDFPDLNFGEGGKTPPGTDAEGDDGAGDQQADPPPGAKTADAAPEEGDAEDEDFDALSYLGLKPESAEQEDGEEPDEAQPQEQSDRLDKNPRFQQVVQQKNELNARVEALQARLEAMEQARQTESLQSDRSAYMDSEAQRITQELRNDPKFVDLEDLSPDAFDALVETRLKDSLATWDAQAGERAEAARAAETAQQFLTQKQQVDAALASHWQETSPAFRASLEGKQTPLMAPCLMDAEFKPIHGEGQPPATFADLIEHIAAYQIMNGSPWDVQELAQGVERGLQALGQRAYHEGAKAERTRIAAREKSPPGSPRRGKAGQAPASNRPLEELAGRYFD